MLPRRCRFRSRGNLVICCTLAGGITLFITSFYFSSFEKLNSGESSFNTNTLLNTSSHKASILNYTLIEDRHPIASSDYFIPRESVVNSFTYTFEIKPKRLCDKDTYLVIMVSSVHSHTNVRSAIRDTWGSVANSRVWPGSMLDLKVKVLFLFGQSKLPSINNLLTQENKENNDILQGSFKDSYTNLTLKTLMGLRYIAEYCPQSHYVLKADEDTFTQVQLLYQFLKEVQPLNSVIGHIYSNSIVKRHGRWAVSFEAYPHHDYPHYAAGNTYVLSRDLIECINSYSSYLPYVPIEDVFVTGIMSIVCRASLINLSGLTYWLERPPSPEDLTTARRITANRVSAGLAREIWREVLKFNTSRKHK